MPPKDRMMSLFFAVWGSWWSSTGRTSMFAREISGPVSGPTASASPRYWEKAFFVSPAGVGRKRFGACLVPMRDSWGCRAGLASLLRRVWFPVQPVGWATLLAGEGARLGLRGAAAR